MTPTPLPVQSLELPKLPNSTACLWVTDNPKHCSLLRPAPNVVNAFPWPAGNKSAEDAANWRERGFWQEPLFTAAQMHAYLIADRAARAQPVTGYYLWEHPELPPRVARSDEADFAVSEPKWVRCYPVDVCGGESVRAQTPGEPAGCPWLFIQMADAESDHVAYLTWCTDEKAIRAAVAQAVYVEPEALDADDNEQVAGITASLIEDCFFDFEGDPGLKLFKVASQEGAAAPTAQAPSEASPVETQDVAALVSTEDARMLDWMERTKRFPTICWNARQGRQDSFNGFTFRASCKDGVNLSLREAIRAAMPATGDADAQATCPYSVGSYLRLFWQEAFDDTYQGRYGGDFDPAAMKALAEGRAARERTSRQPPEAMAPAASAVLVVADLKVQP